MKILLSPHNDDAALFAAFTCLRESPLVITVFDSYVQQQRWPDTDATMGTRRSEDQFAMAELACEPIFMGIPDSVGVEEACEQMLRCLREYQPDQVWAPALEINGHAQHNAVASVAKTLWGGRVTHYLTYTPAGKSTDGRLVEIESPLWIPAKLRALAHYGSQMDPRLGCWPHFVRGLEEYYER